MRSHSATGIMLFGLGFISISVQVFLIREFLKVFQGNELVIGIILSVLMLLTGAGSWLGRFSSRIRDPQAFSIFLFSLMSLLPLLMIMKLDLARSLLFITGSMVSMTGILYIALLVQLLFCILMGFLFTMLSGMLPGHPERKQLPSAYAVEAFGSLMAGVLVNFILLWITGTFLSLKIITICGLTFGILCSCLYFGIYRSLIYFIVSVGIAIVVFISDPASFSRKLRYPEQEVIGSSETPYGEVVVTRKSDQLNYYENGSLLFSSGNVINSEEQVHFAMVQHPDPVHVLVISGGLSGVIPEILKYRPGWVDYLELNPSLIRIGKAYTCQTDLPNIHSLAMDARIWLRRDTHTYDVVMINLPEPSTLQLNRFYTQDFLTDLKKRLRPGAVISLSLPTGSDYISKEGSDLNASLYHTLRTSFAHVLIIPVERNFFLASDSILSIDIPALIIQRGIPTLYVNQYYLDATRMKERSDYIMANIAPEVRKNRDFHPVTFYYQMQFWLSYFGHHPWWLGAMVFILLILLSWSLNPVTVGLFTGGATGASLEILLLLSIQTLYGMVYQMAGIVIMIFMGGLALGSWMVRNIQIERTGRFFVLVQVLLALWSFLTPFMVLTLDAITAPSWIELPVFFLFTLGAALMVGIGYGLAVRLRSGSIQQNVASAYAADLFGAATGSFVIALLLFPMKGLIITTLILSLSNIISAFIFIVFKKKVLSL